MAMGSVLISRLARSKTLASGVSSTLSQASGLLKASHGMSPLSQRWAATARAFSFYSSKAAGADVIGIDLGTTNSCVSLMKGKHAPCQMSQILRHSALTDFMFQRFGFSSSASPQPTKEGNQSVDHDNASQNISDIGANTASSESTDDSTAQEPTQDTGPISENNDSETKSNKKRRKSIKRTAFSDSDAELELSYDDLVKLVAEKEELLKLKHKEIEKMQDKVLRSYAEMENVIDRTKREAENSKKFAIQNFAKSLLDVADNLGRASSVVKESFSKIDTSKDSAGAIPLLKTLLEGVEMTEKQFSEVFRKFGVEKYDPINEQFDPNRHLAVFQIANASKPPGSVAAVLKAGYMIYDRVLRPAEVGVTQALDNETDQSSSA